MKAELLIDSARETERIIKFIKSTVKQAGFEKVVIGLSGGIDSSTVLALSVKALGRNNIFGVMLPYNDWQKRAIEDVFKLADDLKIPRENILNINIKPLVDPIISEAKVTEDLRKGNIMVRMRMIILYDLAKKYKALVMGTENKTEYLLGYFTRFGDEASDIEPLRQLYKSQIYQLARYLKLPEKIIQNVPTAGMWPGQTDEGEFGFTYKEADQILFLHIDKGLSEIEIIKRGYNKEVVRKVLGRMKENEFKHRLPYTLK